MRRFCLQTMFVAALFAVSAEPADAGIVVVGSHGVLHVGVPGSGQNVYGPLPVDATASGTGLGAGTGTVAASITAFDNGSAAGMIPSATVSLASDATVYSEAYAGFNGNLGVKGVQGREVVLSISGDFSGTLGAGAVAAFGMHVYFGDSENNFFQWHNTPNVSYSPDIFITQPGSFNIPFSDRFVVGLPRYDQVYPFAYNMAIDGIVDLTRGSGTISLDPGISVSTDTATPEPSSLVMLGTASISLAAIRARLRRRRPPVST